MQTTNLMNQNIEQTVASRWPQKTSCFLHVVEARSNKQKIRIHIPSRRRESCVTRRTMLAAMRDAELKEWMDSGGDYLDSNYQRTH